jgi:hypothetical protein
MALFDHERSVMLAAFTWSETKTMGFGSDARVQRWFDAIPGGLAWLGLALTIMGAYAAPSAVIGIAALLALYVAARFVLAGIAAVWGLRLIRRWEAVDWRAEYDRRAARDSLPLDAVRHLVIIPNFREDYAVLRRTLDRLTEQRCARDRIGDTITVVLAMEAAEPGAREKGERLRDEYRGAFAEVLVTTHPAGLPGEIPSKSANLAWAARAAVGAIHELPRAQQAAPLHGDPDAVVVTAMDADTLWHPQYFEALSVLFATDPQRYAAFWQAPIRYHANIWTAHPLMRLLHGYSSAWELAYLTAPWWLGLPMSSYSASLRLLDQAGFWDPDAIADEWRMYLKSYFRRGGDQRQQPVFLPFLAQATTGATARDAIRARYWQTFRHAWGAKEIGYALARMMRVPTWGSLRLLLRVAHDNLLAGAGWVILFGGSQLPVWFHPAWARAHLTTLPFVALQAAFLVIALLTVAFWALDMRLRPPRATPWTVRERAVELVSLPLMAVLTMAVVTLPVIHAQTRLMLGKSIEFRVTPKS